MLNKLNTVISQSGLWDGTGKKSHGFLLSPSVYEITKYQQQELTKLGIAISDCLFGLSHIATIAYDQNLNYRGPWIFARKIFSTGVPKIYQELQGMNIKHIPKLVKVDLMVAENGSFKIAEIDGHNKHGLGYSTLGLRFREALFPDAVALPGAVKTLATEIRRMGHTEMKLFHADQERFYVPEFEIARQEFAKYGIDCIIRGEMKVDEAFLEQGLFLDLPFLYHRISLYEKIIPAYKNGQVEFIIPPKPFMGSKGVLALLRNDAKDPEVEWLLRTFIKGHSLALVRQYIPETVLVGKCAEGISAVKTRVFDKRFVLKESISSGMKGTVFSLDEKFDEVLTRACKSNMNWVLQEEVVNQPQTFSWFENGTNGDSQPRTANDWFMRVTAQYVHRELADIVVTARRDKAVHGAKDCIQIGTVIT